MCLISGQRWSVHQNEDGSDCEYHAQARRQDNGTRHRYAQVGESVHEHRRQFEWPVSIQHVFPLWLQKYVTERSNHQPMYVKREMNNKWLDTDLIIPTVKVNSIKLLHITWRFPHGLNGLPDSNTINRQQKVVDEEARRELSNVCLNGYIHIHQSCQKEKYLLKHSRSVLWASVLAWTWVHYIGKWGGVTTKAKSMPSTTSAAEKLI